MWRNLVCFRNTSVILRTYLTQEYITTMQKGYEYTNKLHEVTPPLNYDIGTGFNLALKDKHELCEYLKTMRSIGHQLSVTEVFSQAVIYSFLNNTQELLKVLYDKSKYGVFLDAFSGCYLLDCFLKEDEYSAATQLIAELVLQEETNQLIEILSLKACFKYAATYTENLDNNMVTDDVHLKTSKVRVKFIRNPPKNLMRYNMKPNLNLIGEIMSKLSLKSSNTTLKKNTHLLSTILKSNLTETTDLLSRNNEIYCKDIGSVCLAILVRNFSDHENFHSLEKIFKKIERTSTVFYENILNDLIPIIVTKTETTLINERKVSYERWLKDYKIYLDNAIKQKNKIECEKKNVEALEEIKNRSQNLEFFESKDKLYMDIFKKQVHYPKRWFGKKKKPRPVDDNYVPPEIKRPQLK